MKKVMMHIKVGINVSCPVCIIRVWYYVIQVRKYRVFRNLFEKKLISCIIIVVEVIPRLDLDVHFIQNFFIAPANAKAAIH